VSKQLQTEQPPQAVTLLGVMASLLDAMDRPLLVTDRVGTVLFANVHAQDRLTTGGFPPADQINLFRDLLKMDARNIFGQLERGEQEVVLPVTAGDIETHVKIRWLPEPDWLVTYLDSSPSATPEKSPLAEAQMQQTVHELMQEREITYRNLLAAYLRLQEVNRQKTVFLASAAHELKTPLAVMKGYYDLLLSGSLGKLSKKQGEILEESKESCDRLVRVVSMFLNYSALESGKLVLQLRENDLRDCISDVVLRWQDAFQKARVRLETRISKDLPKLNFDYPKLQQCIANLVDNALKHTPPGGVVKLNAEPHFWERRIAEVAPRAERRHERESRVNSVLVTVSDTGAGIAAEYHQEIFEEFVRVDPSSAGMGLGLAITKRLIQAHRGKIWVDSLPGTGSAFSFLMPTNLD
jgi:signal transduction histidine kinase